MPISFEQILPPIGIEEGERNAKIFKFCCRLRSLNVDYNDAKQLALKAAVNCLPSFPEDEAITCLNSAWKYPPGCDLQSIENLADDTDFQDINKKHAVIMLGGRCLILNEIYDPVLEKNDITFSGSSDFKEFYRNRKIQVGKKQISIAEIWLNHPARRQYNGIIFLPEDNREGYYNLWKGFAYKPVQGDCSLYLDHLKNVICSEDEDLFDYLIAWMADAVQDPGKKPGTSIVLRGAQGVGKGVAIKYFGQLFGNHFVHIASPRHLTGNFNSHLKNASIVFADEAVWGGEKSAEGVLKAMVTEETIPIEHKGKDVFFVKNYVRLMVASNNDWCVPAGLEERRFVIIDVGNVRMQDHTYFKKIIEQMENVGSEALLYYLMNYDLNGIDLRKIPQTAALAEMKYHSMTSVQKFIHDILMAGSWKEHEEAWVSEMPCGDIHDLYIKHAKKTGISRKSTETQVGKELYKIFPHLEKRRKTVICPTTKNKIQVWVYEFPDINEARKCFDSASKTVHDWPDSSAAMKLSRDNGHDLF